MIPLDRLRRLTWSDLVLLVRAGVLVTIIRLALWLRPWPSLLRLVRRLPYTVWASSGSRDFSADRLAWAVRTSSRLVPSATCLAQSLALQCLLTAAGWRCSVEIGVAKNARGEFQAHAWVEHDGATLLSTPAEVTRYARSLTL